MKDVNWTDYHDAVKLFSITHSEPAWMLERRLAVLNKIGELPLPVIERARIDRWKLTEVGNFSEETPSASVPDFTNTGDGPTVVLSGSQTLFQQLPQSLAEQGVIFTDIFTALQEHEALVKKYFMEMAVKVEEDKLTAFHAAFFNGGAFLYVPKNVVVEEPFELTILQQTTEARVFAPHVLIVAGENSEFSYLERIKADGNGDKTISGSVVVEVIAEAGAKVKYAAVDQTSEHAVTYLNRRGYLLRDAHIDWAIGVMNAGDVVADFDSDLVGNGSHSEVKAVAISSGNQKQVIDTRVTNFAPYSIGHILQHGVILEKGTLTFNGIGHIIKGAKNADAQQESRVLMLSDKARGDANPILLIDENEVTAGHAASVGRVDPEEMYYLMSRGLPRHEAERLVIRGFLGSVLVAIPIKSVRDEIVAVIEGKLA